MSFTRLLKKITTGTSKGKKAKSVGITSDLKGISVNHKGEAIEIVRNPDPEATIPELFNKVSRPCPPFCIQAMTVADGVETIGELELLDYLQKVKTGDVIVIDSRLKNWERKGTIPGSTHIPWTSLVSNEGTSLKTIINILSQNFSVDLKEGVSIENIRYALSNGGAENMFDYTHAKTAILFCNGAWCGQTSESIKALLKLGYPPEKLKYYRDGMQGWVSLGLTTVMDNEICTLVE